MRQRPSFIHQSLIVLSLFISLISPALGHDVAADCFQYNLKVKIGDAAPHEEITALEFYDPDSLYFELGGGPGGGKVYRVYPIDGKPTYVLKEYDLSSQRDSDEIAFKKLHRWMPHLEGIEVVHPVVIGKKSMKLPNIEGETLSTVLRDPNLSQAEKNRLLETWNHFIAVANKALPKNPDVYNHEYFNRLTIHSFDLRFRENGKSYPIWLKPNNVIVQAKTGKMFLVDPF